MLFQNIYTRHLVVDVVNFDGPTKFRRSQMSEIQKKRDTKNWIEKKRYTENERYNYGWWKTKIAL